MEEISSCRICGYKEIENFFDLGNQPLANGFLSSAHKKEAFYPLSLSFCHRCCLVQLRETVEPETLFSNYFWVTGTAKATQLWSQKFFEEAKRRLFGKKGFVLEIGSNDGTFLAPFQKDGFKVLGVDPAQNIVDMAVSSGIPTEQLFFGKDEGLKIRRRHQAIDLIIARNVLPHVADTKGFVEGIKTCLSDDGLLVLEVHYAKIIQEQLHYDSIYHEHLCYFSLKTLEYLLALYGLFIYDLIESPISGGSVVVFARKIKTRKSQKLKVYIKAEETSRTNSLASWKKFTRNSFKHAEILSKRILEQKNRGKIVGYGASARASTLLNFCGLDSRIVSTIADDNPLKQDHFTPGSHIPIKSAKEVFSARPGCVIVLAWNFTYDIIRNLKTNLGYHGLAIVPLPGFPRVLSI